jgi:hypothetical protein
MWLDVPGRRFPDMRFKTILVSTALAALAAVTFLVAQDPGTRQAYIWVKDNAGHHFVPLNGAIAIATDGKSATVSAGKSYTFGSGFVTVDAGTGTVQVSLDTAYVLYRTQPPAGPGACTMGSGAIAGATDGYLYLCVPDGTGQGFRWARAPMETNW